MRRVTRLTTGPRTCIWFHWAAACHNAFIHARRLFLCPSFHRRQEMWLFKPVVRLPTCTQSSHLATRTCVYSSGLLRPSNGASDCRCNPATLVSLHVVHI